MSTTQDLIIPPERAERPRPNSPAALVPGGDGAMVMQIIERMMRAATFDPVAIREMLAIKKEYEADEARKSYMVDMAEFKKNPPVIFKNKHVGYSPKSGGRVDYDHATHSEVTMKVIAGLAANGFTHRWVPTQPDGLVCVTCIITHRLGHSESLSLTAPPDISGNKSPVQAILSTKTLLERHLLLAATGLTSEDMPDADDRTDEGGDRPELPVDVINALKDAAIVGSDALAICFKGLAETTRARIVADYHEEWTDLKAEAAKVKRQ